MKNYILHNEQLTVSISSFGAELQSIINNSTQKEYLWHGDAAFWGRRSPVLFPIVGSLRNKQYTYKDQTYSMNQHGFARDMEFEMIQSTDTSIIFSLTWNEATYAIYPFHFKLNICYTLDGNTVTVAWQVQNLDDNTMYFSIGGHPAFLCPLDPNEAQTDCSLQFDCDHLTVTNISGNGLAMKQTQTIQLTDGNLPIHPHLFDDDALILEHGQAHKVSLVNGSQIPYLTVKFDAPLFGVWSPAKKNAPFVCIEPWYGRCDGEDYTGTLEEREYGNQLSAGEVFDASYSITIENL